MNAGQGGPTRWSSWSIEVKVWKVLAALVVLPILVLWFKVVHQTDEILLLVRNEVVTDATRQRNWTGRFVNTNDRTLRDVAVMVHFLDSRNHTVGKIDARTDEMRFGMQLDLHAPLPRDAVRLRIHSVQWRMDRTAADRWLRGISGAALIGPFEPWEFGYLMGDAAADHGF
jgi:hypothetical protein